MPVGTPIPRGRPPWPTYYDPNVSADETAAKALAIGLLDAAIHFESHNLNRPEWLEAFARAARGVEAA